MRRDSIYCFEPPPEDGRESGTHAPATRLACPGPAYTARTPFRLPLHPFFACCILLVLIWAIEKHGLAEEIPDKVGTIDHGEWLKFSGDHVLGPFPTASYEAALHRFHEINGPPILREEYLVQPLDGGHSRPAVRPAFKSAPADRFDWRASTRQSLLYTGIMHTFNLWTEAGTRDTLNGPWLKNYLDSVSELRGWSDSDMFMSPYVGHTIEGSIFGFIQRQNDPRYSRVQWGDGRDYFLSLLHSMAYSAVWHTQWKIGPASEASIGNVMLHASPGFITLTDTPTLGAVAMIAEDAADRYLIMGLENRTANRMIIVVARSFLNPGRSFANIMAFRLPWNRATRLGVFGENFRIRQQLLAESRISGEKPFEFERPVKMDTAPYPREAPIELEAFPVFETFLGGAPGPCVGGGGSGAARVNPQLQVLAEVSGCLITGMPASNQSGDSLFYGGGARWTPRAANRVSPYVQVMFGGKKVTHETDNIPLRNTLLAEWNDGNGTLPHYPRRSDWSVEDSRNGPALGFGGGVDLVVARPFAWRLLKVEYTHAWMTDPGMLHPQNTLRITTGAVLRIGTW